MVRSTTRKAPAKKAPAKKTAAKKAPAKKTAAKKTAAKKTAAKKAAEAVRQAGAGPEEFLLYVRVPRKQDSQEKVSAYLEYIANLLSDEKNHIYIEDYETVDGTQKPRSNALAEAAAAKAGLPPTAPPVSTAAAARAALRMATAAGAGAGADSGGGNPEGGDKSTLHPTYFCHNKY